MDRETKLNLTNLDCVSSSSFSNHFHPNHIMKSSNNSNRCSPIKLEAFQSAVDAFALWAEPIKPANIYFSSQNNYKTVFKKEKQGT